MPIFLRAAAPLLLLALCLLAALPAAARAQQAAEDPAPYYPGPAGTWERRAPEAMGFNPDSLQAAIAFAQAHESEAPRDLEQAHYQGGFSSEPFGAAIGPFKSRGDMTGVIVRHGYILAEWGEPKRVDMTFSVTKSFLSTAVGLAVDRGLIGSVQDSVWTDMAPVVPAVASGGAAAAGMDDAPDALLLFESEHNRAITWDHLLRQTSDWQGTLWGKPDWSDRPRGAPSTWTARARNDPGTVYKYNDVRVNLLALAAMNVWREPLPQVLRRHIMEPLGASRTWRWHGYYNSWVVMDGRRLQAVSGGGHWGGGMWISARDQARFGLFTLRRGRWAGQQLLSEAWFEQALTPTAAEPGYGFMNFFLNTDRERFPAAPESAYAHLGSGVNMVYVDPVHDLVVVTRWIDGDATAEFIRRVLAAVEEAEG